MARASLKSLEWSPRFVAIYKCSRPEKKSKKLIVSQLKLAGGEELESDPDLRRVVHALQDDFIAKPVNPQARNPTSRLLFFKQPEDGGLNDGKAHLERLLEITATDLDEVRRQTRALAKRYAEVPRVQEGVLIFLASEGCLDGSAAGAAIFVFKCDFEAISKVSRYHLFQQIKDAIVEKTRKAALYPVFQRGRFDHDTMRVFDESGETRYWLSFLDLGERAGPSVAAATLDLVKEDVPELADLKIDEARHSLRSGDHPLPVRVPPDKGMEIIKSLADKKLDTNVTLRLGEVSVTAPLSQFGVSWIIAEDHGQAYILIKGSKLENRTSVLTAINFIEFGSLPDAMAKLEI